MEKLVIEYHYENGELDTYHAGNEAQALWNCFADKTKAGYIIIRKTQENEQRII